MLNTHCILFAAPLNPELIFAIIAILVMVVRVISAVFGGNNANIPGRRPPGVPPPQGQGQGQGTDQLKGEIDEFLRRVSTRREGQPQQRGGAKPGRPIVVARQVGPANPQNRSRRPAPVIVSTAGSPVVAEVIESPGGRDIDDHVKRFLDNKQFGQRADKLTSIDQKERQFDQQVQQAFAHDVGHLKPSTLAPPADDRSVSQSAPQVIDDQKQQNISFALLTGSNLINAVIISEIMQRPEHRW